MTVVKICGITKLEDARQAVELGADMLGLNFYVPSPRYLQPEAARQITDALCSEYADRCPVLVGIFVNATAAEVAAIIERAGLDFAQLSGDEPPESLRPLHGQMIKAIRPRDKQAALDDLAAYQPYFPQDPRAPSVVLDAYHPALYGGTGEQASTDVALAIKARVPRMMLAGGLHPGNVAERAAAVQPWGVDVASGVEGDQPGHKDADKMRQFIAAAKGHGS